MKKLKLMALGLLSVGMMTITSCAKDEDPATPSPNLTVVASTATVQGGDNENIEITSNSDVTFTITGASVGGTDLKSIGLVITGPNALNPIPETAQGYNLNSGAADLDNADEDVYNDVLTIDGSFWSNAGPTIYRFTLTDNNNKTRTVNITVTVNDPVPLDNEKTGAFFHIAGSLQGAYDLITAQPIAGTGASADPSRQDMKNTDAAGDIFSGSWTAANATLFVKSNSFDYENATEASAAAAYDDGTPGPNINNPFIGDIYIAKLRGTDDYAVIQITDVNPTDNTCACGNRGKITFDFKKK
jgi:hypothetical protein